MGAYKNDYKKEEDFALWELHEIRNKIAKKCDNPKYINNRGKSILKKYKLKRIKISKN